MIAQYRSQYHQTRSLHLANQINHIGPTSRHTKKTTPVHIGYNISQPDSLLLQGHLVMFLSDTLQCQTDLVHELNKSTQYSAYLHHAKNYIFPSYFILDHNDLIHKASYNIFSLFWSGPWQRYPRYRMPSKSNLKEIFWWRSSQVF